MEATLGSTTNQMVQNDQLGNSCGHDKAIFYCLKACNNEIPTHQPVYFCFDKGNCNCTFIKKLDIFCCISDLIYQREYCVMCGEKIHFDHGAMRTFVIVEELDKYHWAPLFEKIQHLQEQVIEKYEPYHDLVIMLEDMYKKKVVRDPQNSPLFSDMHLMLKSLYEQITTRYKEEVEELMLQKNVTELFRLKDAYHSLNTTYETVKHLELFDPQDLYERYIEIFQYPFNKESLIKLSQPNFLLIKEYKKKFVESIINSSNQIIPNENKQEVINLLFLEYFAIEETQNLKMTQEFNQKLVQEEVNSNNRIDDVNSKLTVQVEEIKQETKQFVNTETLSDFKNEISHEIKQMSKSYNQKYEILQSQFLELKQRLEIEFDDISFGLNTLEFEGEQWRILFGVNSSDIFPYNNDFWTKREEMNPQPEKRIERFKNSFKLKAFWKFKIEKLLILSESGMHTILQMPSKNKSLMDYFNDEDTVTNLTYVSGAKDPVELINKNQGINFYEQVWRINSKRTDGVKFMTRLGGYYYDYWGNDERNKDNKQQVINAEMAGFGILDEWNSNVYGKKSFGIRTYYDQTSGQGQVQIGAIVCAL